eukprot:m.326641 g.326641  ORF g.326641 m.326641 type:complete len:108 (-) comp55576_c2_seq3:239-562(-)
MEGLDGIVIGMNFLIKLLVLLALCSKIGEVSMSAVGRYGELLSIPIINLLGITQELLEAKGGLKLCSTLAGRLLELLPPPNDSIASGLRTHPPGHQYFTPTMTRQKG